MDGPFDGVAIIVDDHDDGGDAVVDESAEFLDGQLGCAVTDEQDWSPLPEPPCTSLLTATR